MQNYIEKVHIKGFRHFNEMDVTFNPRFNFIVGPNGCGKTSLLRGIILSFSYSNLEDSRYDKEFEIWVDLFLNGLKNRFGGIQSKGIEIKSNYREYPDMRLDAPPNEDDINSLKIPYEVSNDGLYSPLVLGAYRRIEYKRIEGMVREHEVLESRREYLRKAADNLNGGNLPDVKQWLINRYFIIDKEWASIEKENWNWLIANMEYIVPKDWDFKFSRIERGLEPIFNLNGSECYLEELSAGFQSMLSIIFAIFEWIEKTNSGDKSLVKSAEGTVIIDELCAHLHPEWQLVVKDVLCKIFPGLQFIVTTHSPHMI
ncbi:MAG: AAA family ATPase, partial [Cetobacterium sp.]